MRKGVAISPGMTFSVNYKRVEDKQCYDKAQKQYSNFLATCGIFNERGY